MNYDDDRLERALFDMPLEEPPADLRESILAQTIHRPPATMHPWEVWAYGVACAMLAWVLILVLRGAAHGSFTVAESYAGSLLAAFARPQVLFWLAAGASAAIWISHLNFMPRAQKLQA